MAKISGGIIIFLLAWALPGAQAIVVGNYTIAEMSPTNQGYNIDWNHVHSYRGASAVAVDDYWLLTAGHVVGGSGSITINGETYNQVERIWHNAEDDPDNDENADLSMVRVDKQLPGYYPLYTETIPTDNRLEGILIGFGNTGDVVEATGGGPFATDYYTDSGSGAGTRRWGTQMVADQLVTEDYGLGNTNKGFRMDFDLDDSDYEAGVADKDSGSGVFVQHEGVWKLAGINTRPDIQNDDEHVASFAVSVPEYQTWIANTIPEASTLVYLLLFGGLGLYLRRRRQAGGNR